MDPFVPEPPTRVAHFFVTVGQDASPDGPLTRVPAAGSVPVQIGEADGAVLSDGCLFVIDFVDGVSSVTSAYSTPDGED